MSASIDEPKQFVPLNIAVLTISDTRSLADDKSGTTLADRLVAAGHTLAAREIIAVGRQTRIAEMHVAFAEARAADDRAAARRLVGRLVTLYSNRPEMAHARAQVDDATRAIIDGRDLIDFTERSLLRPLDEKAQGEIAAAAKRVSLVTAISPRAILDVERGGSLRDRRGKSARIAERARPTPTAAKPAE